MLVRVCVDAGAAPPRARRYLARFALNLALLIPSLHHHPSSLFFNKELELSLVGLQNAGKTSLATVLAAGEFQEVRKWREWT